MERQLPLVALLLIESHYPVDQCASVKDNDGRLPIHYAVENDSPVEIVDSYSRRTTCVRDEDLPYFSHLAAVRRSLRCLEEDMMPKCRALCS